MTGKDYPSYRSIFQGRRMPFAFVDLDLLDENIRQVRRRAGDKPIRIASKSIRCRAMLSRILQADPSFQGIMAYSGAEAIYLSREGFDDILVAYPVWDAETISGLCRQLRAGKAIYLTVDSPEHVNRLASLGREHRVEIPLCLEVDLSLDLGGVHFGVFRSPIRTARGALELAQLIRRMDYVGLQGLMAYEAQIAGVPDFSPAHNFLVRRLLHLLKTRSVRALRRQRETIVAQLRERGFDLNFVNGGGTGSLESTRTEPWVTEVSVGSGFFSPRLFDYYRAFRHLPAAGFAIEITRRPARHIYTCNGGGLVASGSAGVDKLPLPYLPQGARLTREEGAGEVQTPVIYRGREKLQIGDPVFLRHAKAGELCEHFNSLYLISGEEIVDEVLTYRGEGHCFL